MDIENLLKFVTWRKTNYVQPHEYFMQKEYPEVFNVLVRKIKNEGTYEEFQGKKYKYLIIGQYQYWSVYPALNRAKL